MSSLARLLTFGIDTGLFNIKPISEIDKSCCPNVAVEVIDFDETKTKISGLGGLQQPKSCDGLKIIPQRHQIDFIEFKSFEKFKQYQLTRIPKEQRKNAIQTKISSFGLKQKIDDSLFIFNFVTLHKDFKMTVQEREEINTAIKNYIILIDIALERNPLTNLAVTLDYLSDEASHDEVLVTCIKDEISGIDICYLTNKPVLMSCDKVSEYYQGI